MRATARGCFYASSRSSLYVSSTEAVLTVLHNGQLVLEATIPFIGETRCKEAATLLRAL